MVKIKDCPLLNINDNSFLDSKLVATNSENSDFLISIDNLIYFNRVIRLFYNENDNVYELPIDLKIYKNELFESLRFKFLITNDQKNTKMGVSLRLSDGNIIPIVHSSLYNHSLISKTGLNEGSNEFYYAANMDSFVFSNPFKPIGLIKETVNTIIPNGYIKRNGIITDYNLNDYPSLKSVGISNLVDLENRFLRAAGNLAPFRTLQDDTLQRFKVLIGGLPNLEVKKGNKNNAGTGIPTRNSEGSTSANFIIIDKNRTSTENSFDCKVVNYLMRV